MESDAAWLDVRHPAVTLLFKFAVGCAGFRCDLLDHGALGTEAHFSKDGELLIARTV